MNWRYYFAGDGRAVWLLIQCHINFPLKIESSIFTYLSFFFYLLSSDSYLLIFYILQLYLVSTIEQLMVNSFLIFSFVFNFICNISYLISYFIYLISYILHLVSCICYPILFRVVYLIPKVVCTVCLRVNVERRIGNTVRISSSDCLLSSFV